MHREQHWSKHVSEAAKCDELASEAAKRGDEKARQFWRGIEKLKANDAQTARSRQMFWEKPRT